MAVQKDYTSKIAGGGGQSLTASLPLKIDDNILTNNGTGLRCTGANAWAEGLETTASGSKSHAEGHKSVASGDNSHAEGYNTKATAHHSHAEGFETQANEIYSHSEGSGTKTSGMSSHAEGDNTIAVGYASHAEGYNTRSNGNVSHAEGSGTIAGGTYSHAEGYNTSASGANSHAEGNTTLASGASSHANGEGTRATGANSTAVGKYNDDGTALFVVGDGTADNTRSDCFKVDSNGETWVKISGVLTKITSLGGGSGIPIYPTLQDAITDQANLPVGTIFETNGFHTSGDGGAARYKVSSTGTANGKDIITLGTGKLAVLQVQDSLYPEQLGCVRGNSSYNLGDYISHANSMGIRKICLHASSSYYYMTSSCTISSPDITIEGSLNIFSGYSSRIEWTGATGNMFNVEHRRFTIRNVYLNNSSGNASAICFNSSTNNGNHFKYTFENIHVSGFGYGVSFTNDTHWMHLFKDVIFAACDVGVYVEKFLLCTKFDGCYFYVNTSYNVRLKCEPTAVVFDNCNFGSISHAVYIEYFDGPDHTRFGQIDFLSCSFEYDTDDSSIVNDSGFLSVDDEVCVNITFSACNFSIQRLYYNQYTTARALSFGKNTRVSFIGCQGAKLNEYAYRKQLFNENKPPMLDFGSIRIVDNCQGIEVPSYGSPYDNVCVYTDRTEIQMLEHYGTNVFDKTTSWILQGISFYQDGSDVVFEYSSGLLSRTLVIPIPSYWVGKTLTFSFPTTSHNRFACTYANAVPYGSSRYTFPYIGGTGILTTDSGRDYFTITVSADYKFILIYFANNIGDDSLFAGGMMATEDGSHTTYSSYVQPTTSLRFNPSLIDLDALVTALNARGNTLS